MVTDWPKLWTRCVEAALARGLSMPDAEDVAQEAMCAALERGPTYPLTYALRCVTRACRSLAVRGHAPGTAVSRHTHDELDEGLLATPAIAEDLVIAAPLIAALEELGRNASWRRASNEVGGAARAARHRARRHARAALDR